jgi:hypothetical protein
MAAVQLVGSEIHGFRTFQGADKKSTSLIYLAGF